MGLRPLSINLFFTYKMYTLNSPIIILVYVQKVRAAYNFDEGTICKLFMVPM